MMRISRLATAFAVQIALILFSFFPATSAADCTTVNSLISTCSTFVTYGSPDPSLDPPCCMAMTTLNSMADSPDNRRAVCRCMMDLIISSYNPSANAIATLPGFCGVSLGFTIDPNTDCDYIIQQTKVEGR